MTAEILGSITGVILSLAFSYVPGLSARFALLNSTYKRLVMGILLIVAAAAIYGLSCANVVTAVVCDRDGAIGLIEVLVAALVANQATHRITGR